MLPYGGKGMDNGIRFNHANAGPLSVWRLHATRKQSRLTWIQCFLSAIRSHFCYACGELIVKSALRTEIQTALAKHYRTCRLFDDVPSRRR
jgi:hypothetical protein